MFKPLPGPGLMLPVLDLDSTPDLDHHVLYKQRQAKFKRQVSLLHSHWCLCGSYLNHFLPNTEPLRNEESCGEEKDGDEVVAAGGEGVSGGNIEDTGGEGFLAKEQ
nr:ORF2 [Torque teno felis virus]